MTIETIEWFFFIFSSRQKLSSLGMIKKGDFLSSSGVERSAVNRFVVGSNPTWGDFIWKQIKQISPLNFIGSLIEINFVNVKSNFKLITNKMKKKVLPSTS